MARFDLTDFEWSVIAPLLPNKVRGVKRVDDRRVLNGIFWRLRTGAPWADNRHDSIVRREMPF
jgi:transposase